MTINFSLTPLRDRLPFLPTNGLPSNSVGADESAALDVTTGIIYFKDPIQGWIVAFTPAASGGSSPPSGPAGGDLGGTYPNPTVSKVHATSGNIDGVAIGQSTPAPCAVTTFNATSANILGQASAEGLNSTTNGNPASTANTGVNIGSSANWASETFYDQTRGADAKTADVVWQSGVFSMRFKNDAGGNATTWLSGTGAYNAITGIASNSGSGAWAHTGAMTVSGLATLSGGYTVATLPAASTALKGARAFVTDANNPVWNSPVAGSGANTVPVFCNGNSWVCA